MDAFFISCTHTCMCKMCEIYTVKLIKFLFTGKKRPLHACFLIRVPGAKVQTLPPILTFLWLDH